MVAPIRFTEVRDWLFGTALPFWAAVGVDRVHGGFVEHLDLAGRDGMAPFKRVRAQARQIYCFAQGALLGWQPGREVAEHGWRFLSVHGRRADGAWVRRMNREGGVLDPTCDAYDMAFVLLAHAWMFRLTGDGRLVDGAISTVEALDRVLAHPAGNGWLVAEGQASPREQNPHMHITEAAVELALATGNPRLAAFARRAVALAERFIFDSEGLLHEFFDERWTPLDGPLGRIVEPGHLMEWAWILNHGKAVLGPAVRPRARLLHEWAERVGVDPKTGLTFDQVDRHGAVLAPDHRSWPQAETLKANLAMLEHEGLDTRERIAACTANLLDRYLAVTPAGTWTDHIAAGGQPRVERIPSTTLYHLQSAFTELLRLQTRIEAFETPAGRFAAPPDATAPA